MWVCVSFINSFFAFHYNDVIMGTIASQVTSLTIVYSTVYSDADQRKHQSSASLAFVQGIHRWPVNSPHKWPVPWKMFPFYDVIMYQLIYQNKNYHAQLIKNHKSFSHSVSLVSVCKGLLTLNQHSFKKWLGAIRHHYLDQSWTSSIMPCSIKILFRGRWVNCILTGLEICLGKLMGI